MSQWCCFANFIEINLKYFCCCARSNVCINYSRLLKQIAAEVFSEKMKGFSRGSRLFYADYLVISFQNFFS